MEFELTRYDAIKILMEYVTDEIVVCNIGIPSKELFKIKDREKNFYMLGSMGLSSSIGHGISLSIEKKVIAIDGDGSVLMNMGSLATIGKTTEKNFLLFIVDNCAYGSTGNQKTHSSCTDLYQVSKACAIDSILVINEIELRNALKKVLNERGTNVILVKARAHNENVPNITLVPTEIKHRFMNSLKKE
ncbi:thiamine pyrophosphate protein domain protein TPP-binding [Methanococcus vannielii SB]|jgi:sulfopyruvate decarboxylase subunit beta|uniref:sulfopyruvate decarboxylase n=1 Tax=Methanococcus vannielii (strain ATCC 35089 / DSM 1224 / JCM 13029 / OCM 148 / SB) TaxID=406327 RepID=A6UQX2_METVS|nr:sulfopyruvate decarboxylase subunit beta [Methanococcus vannielii]ABR54894.1 thiamine pyrophosphate protein domain protein TPP-binding [Methanococcus vannielii SB]